jgi:hypothetical protein
MSVKTVALLNQTFRVDVRQVRTHLLRGAFAAFVLFILVTIHEDIRSLGAPGLEFVRFLSVLSFVMLTMCGAFYFPSVITEEKEQQTLGLLRMAGVGPATLLVGKSLGRLGVVLLLMAVTLPYWWLAVTLGGVTLWQVGAVAVVLGSHLVLVSQVGTFFSVVCRTTGRACVWSTIVILSLLAGPAILYGILLAFGGAGTWEAEVLTSVERLFAPSRLIVALSSAYGGGLLSMQCAVNLAGAVMLFGLSWLLFDRFNTYAVVSDAAATSRWWLPARLRGRGSSGRRAPQRARANAILWKDFRQIAGGRKWMWIRVAVCGLIVGFSVLFLMFLESNGLIGGNSVYYFRAMGVFIVVVTLFAAGIDAILLSAQVFQREVKEQTWDTLRTLPMTLRGVCARKVGGTALGLLPWLGLEVIGLVMSYEETIDEYFDEFDRWPLEMTFVSIYCVMLTIFAVYLVSFFSLKTNPWLGIVLATGAWGATVFTGLFCCFEVFDLDGQGEAFITFWMNSMVVAVIILLLHGQIAGMLRGEKETG